MGKELLKTNQIELAIANQFTIEIANTKEQLAEAKKLDDLAFGAHVGISMEELIEIQSHGAVILLKDQNGKIVGESQVITSPVSQHTALAPDEAFNYGTAIHPDYQNHGIAQKLFKAQEAVAIEAGKAKNTLTARLENAQSLRGRFKAGYKIVGYDPSYYGSLESGGARLVLEKNHTIMNETFSPETLSRKISKGIVPILEPSSVESTLNSGFIYIGVIVTMGDNVDFSSHALVSKIFEQATYEGVGLIKLDELGFEPSNQSILVFKHK